MNVSHCAAVMPRPTWTGFKGLPVDARPTGCSAQRICNQLALTELTVFGMPAKQVVWFGVCRDTRKGGIEAGDCVVAAETLIQ